MPAVLAVAVFAHGATTSPHFLDLRYLLDSSTLYVETGLLALGMTLVIVAGAIDLSVAATLALVACVVTKLLNAGWPALAALPFGLGLGAALGAINGLLVARFRLPSFMVTFATMAAYRGLAQVLVGTQSARVPTPLTGLDLVAVPGTPIPAPLAVFGVAALAVALVRHRTVFGRRLVALGTNERAAFYAGVPTAQTTVGVFALSGLLAGLAGLLIASRLGVARYDHGRGTEVDAIVAVVLGGASIAGGSGTVAGTLLALLLVGLLRTDMGLANVTAEYQLAAIGTLLIGAVLLGRKKGR